MALNGFKKFICVTHVIYMSMHFVTRSQSYGGSGYKHCHHGYKLQFRSMKGERAG